MVNRTRNDKAEKSGFLLRNFDWTGAITTVYSIEQMRTETFACKFSSGAPRSAWKSRHEWDRYCAHVGWTVEQICSITIVVICGYSFLVVFVLMDHEIASKRILFRCFLSSDCSISSVSSGTRELSRLLLGPTRKKFLEFTNGSPRVETFGAGSGAVHDCMTPIHWEWVSQPVQTFLRRLISRVNHPPISLHQSCRAKILVAIPPIAGAWSWTTGAKDAFVQTVEFPTIVDALEILFEFTFCLFPL